MIGLGLVAFAFISSSFTDQESTKVACFDSSVFKALDFLDELEDLQFCFGA